ncbi:MAG: DUF4097 domain-containing protein [Thermoanaerobaculia bacterium]
MRNLTPRTMLSALALLAAFTVLSVSPALAGEFRMEKTLALGPGGVLDLKTEGGRVIVRGTSRSDALVIVTSKDEDVEDHYDFIFEEHGDRAVVRAERRGSVLRRWFSWNESPHFEVEVPRITDLELRTSGGRISVEDIDGTADLHTSGGRITLDSITGVVDASTSGGSISAARLGDSAELHTSGGSIAVEGVAGNLLAETSGGSIKISDAAGKVDADTSGGSITAYFTAGNAAGGSLESSGGRITAYIDADAALDLDASSSGGGVSVDLPVTIRGKISRRSVRGTLNGGGALLRLHTSGGGVSVRSL